MEQNVKNQNIQLDNPVVQEFWSKLKSNPNDWPIITRWNHLMFQKYKFKIYPIIQDIITQKINEEANIWLERWVYGNKIEY